MQQIGLIGDMDAGKTCFLGGLYAEYCGPQPFPALRDEHIRQSVREEGWEHCANFMIDNIKYPSDREMLSIIADGLRAKPEMKFPARTQFSRGFPMDIRFLAQNLFNRSKINYTESLSLIDIPGLHLSPTYPDKSARDHTIQGLINSDAFIVFIDTESCLTEESRNRSKTIIHEIGTIIQTVAKANETTQKFTPVSIVFTKFDVINSSDAKSATETMCEEFAIELSEYSSMLFVMACPISIVNPVRRSFQAFNLQFPFLFSSMGIIFAHYLTASNRAQASRALRSESLWQRFKQFLAEERTIGSIEREAARERRLARVIFEYLCIEETLGLSLLRFVQSGRKVSLSQIGTDL